MGEHTVGGSRSWRAIARGISLVETMTVLAVLAVLASMALPSYQSQLAKSRRAEATLAFYAGLNAEQKKAFDAETARFMAAGPVRGHP